MALRRVTVIDDSPEVVALFDELFRQEGVDVTMLGERADVDHVVRSEPELLVVDLRLGTDHLPGWELIRHMRSHPALVDVPILVCSGALDQMRDHGGAGGTRPPKTYLLPKPFSLRDLESVLDEALHGTHRAASAARAEPNDLPDFSSDPHAWFARIGHEVRHPGWLEMVERLQPAQWVRADGHAWRLMRTTRGVEVRPELMNPFLRYNDQPAITALGFGEEIEVELTTRDGRWVGRFQRGAVDLAGLGQAMLDERKLPHDNLSALFPAKRPPVTPLGTGEPERTVAFPVANGTSVTSGSGA